MEQSLSVPVGQVITLNVGLSNGSTIYNMDGANAIWVSANPGVFSGIGMKIGPKGTLSWAGNSACYAIADAVATGPVPITISDNASGMTNPVDVGVAVALGVANTALSLTGTTMAGIADNIAGKQLNATVGGSVGVSNTAAIGTAVGTAVAGQQLTIGAIPNGVSVSNAAAIGTAVAANPLSLDTATKNGIATAVGTAVASQNLTIGAITGGNVSVVNTSVIGNDVAVAVNTAGVPTLPRFATLLNTTASTNLGGGVFQVKYNTNLLNWASLIVTSTFTGPGVFYYEFYDSVSDPTLTRPLASKTYQQATASPIPVQFSTPVLGNTILITTVLNGTTSASGLRTFIVGSNQLLKAECLSNDAMFYSVLSPASWGTNVFRDYPNAYNCPGGWHYLQATSSNTGTTPNYLQIQYQGYDILNQLMGGHDIANLREGTQAPNNASQQIFTRVILPPGVISFTARNGAVAGTISSTLSVYPER